MIYEDLQKLKTLENLVIDLEIKKINVQTELQLRRFRTEVEELGKTFTLENENQTIIRNLEAYIFEHYTNGGILRKRQIDIFEDLYNFVLEGKTYGKIILPTGVGKTILFLEFIKALNLPSLIVVPTQNLVDQTGEKITQFNPDLEFGKIYAKAKELERQVTIITYDSLVIGLKVGTVNLDDYKVLILDEAHTSLSELRQEAISRFKNENKLILEFTATDKYSNDKKLTSETIHEMQIVEAVEVGLLSPFSCVFAQVDTDLSNVSMYKNGEYNEVEFMKVVRKASVNQNCVKFYKKYFDEKVAMVFVANIEQGEDLEDLFNQQYGYGYATSFNGYTKNDEAMFRNLKNGKTKIVIGVAKLATGFDLPEASVCLNLYPTASVVRATQRGGRVLRIDPENSNKHAVIVDFIYEDDRDKAQPVTYPEIAGQSFALQITEENKENASKLAKNSKRKMGQFAKFYENIDDLDIKIAGLGIIENPVEVMRITRNFIKNREQITKNQKLDFEKIQDISRKNEIKSSSEYSNKSSSLSLPSIQTLKEYSQFTTWDEFFNRELKQDLSFDDIQEIVRKARIQSSGDYKIRSSQLKLPTARNLIRMPEWLGWDEFLGRNIKEKISFVEVKRLTLEAGIKTSTEYTEKAIEIGLPCYSITKDYPEFTTWDEFFEREKLSFEEIQEIVKREGITNCTNYSIKASELKLPAAQTLRKYPEFTSWDEFFGHEIKKELYFQEVQKIARLNLVKTSGDYENRASELKLPCLKSLKKMSEFTTWDEFFEREKDLSFDQIRKKSSLAGIKSSSEYVKKAVNLGLPSIKSLKKMSDFTTWDEFFGR
jgi:superfamily II DNA or RNA helicase